MCSQRNWDAIPTPSQQPRLRHRFPKSGSGRGTSAESPGESKGPGAGVGGRVSGQALALPSSPCSAPSTPRVPNGAPQSKAFKAKQTALYAQRGPQRTSDTELSRGFSCLLSGLANHTRLPQRRPPQPAAGSSPGPCRRPEQHQGSGGRASGQDRGSSKL